MSTRMGVVDRGSWAGARVLSTSDPRPTISSKSAIHPFRLHPSAFKALLAIVLLAAAALRIPGLFTDFWGDEIWSWSIAGQLHSVFDVLMAAPAHIDNNHPLNTLVIYLMGQNQPVWLYRLPALLAGIGSVALAARIMSRRGRVEAIIAALLLSFSYPLIFYSSEARGYSFAVFFSLLSFDSLQSALASHAPKKYAMELLFSLACVMGLLSHLTFLHIYAGALVWSMIRIRRLEPTTRLRACRLARLHFIPVIFSLLLLHFFVRDMVIGGAPPTSSRVVFLQTFALTAGGAETGALGLLAAIIVGLFFLGGLVFLARDGTAQWTFFLVAVLIAPALATARDLDFSERPQPLMLRYFLVCIAMLLLSVCPLLGYLWRRGPICKLLISLLFFAYIVGNEWHVESFLKSGRGHYAEALDQIARQTTGPTIAISSDNPLRTQMLIQFYGPRIAPGRRITVDADPHAWLILNRIEPETMAVMTYRNKLYSMVYNYPFSGLSGWSWRIYRIVS